MPHAMHMLLALVSVIVVACGEKTEEPAAEVAGPAARLLVGEIPESVLPVIRYKRITDGMGGSVRGGGEHYNEMLRLDAVRHKPLATQWAGIRSLDPIPGKGDKLFFRYDVIAEIYADPESAERREDGFDAGFRAYLDGGGEDKAKSSMPTVHFSHGRVFYVLITDMSASWDAGETGRLKFAIMKHLTE